MCDCLYAKFQVSVSSGNLLSGFSPIMLKVVRARIREKTRDCTLHELSEAMDISSEHGNGWRRKSFCGELTAMAEYLPFVIQLVLSTLLHRSVGMCKNINRTLFGDYCKNTIVSSAVCQFRTETTTAALRLTCVRSS